MKKTLIALGLASILLLSPIGIANASTKTLTPQQRLKIEMLIVSLLQQVQILENQLAILQYNQNISGTATTSSSTPFLMKDENGQVVATSTPPSDFVPATQITIPNIPTNTTTTTSSNTATQSAPVAQGSVTVEANPAYQSFVVAPVSSLELPNNPHGSVIGSFLITNNTPNTVSFPSFGFMVNPNLENNDIGKVAFSSLTSPIVSGGLGDDSVMSTNTITHIPPISILAGATWEMDIYGQISANHHIYDTNNNYIGDSPFITTTTISQPFEIILNSTEDGYANELPPGANIVGSTATGFGQTYPTTNPTFPFSLVDANGNPTVTAFSQPITFTAN